MDLYERLLLTSERHRLFQPGCRVLAACSGGLDSACLLHLLSRLAEEGRLQLSAVTVDHGLRPFGDERAATTAFCRKLGIEHHVAALEPGLEQRAAAAGLSLEHAARNERHALLQSVALSGKADRIALGHHANDQVETMIMRLARGTGLSGLRAMRPVSRAGKDGGKAVPLVRPLLQVSSAELEDYAARYELPVVEDPTNRSSGFLRNRIRRSVIPELCKVYPEAVSTMARSALVFGSELEAIAVLVDDRLEGAVKSVENGLSVPIRRLGRGALRKLLLHRLFERVCDYPPETKHFDLLERFLDAEEGSARLELPRGVVVLREYSELTILAAPGPRPTDFRVEVTGPGRWSFPGGTLIVSVDQCAEVERVSGERTALFSAEDTRFPLLLRSWGRGDRFHPFGMDGTQKISDLFVDRKVPRGQRCRVPILTDREGAILWVAGLRRSTLWPAVSGQPAYLFELIEDAPSATTWEV